MQNISALKIRASKPFIVAALLASVTLVAASGNAATAQSSASQGGAAPTCTPVATAAQLNAIRNNLAGSYCITADIDAGTIANFVPIGDGDAPFTGKLFGKNHMISNLNINNAGDLYVGLFGYINGATIQDLGLNVNITATASSVTVGGLTGIAIAEGAAVTIKRVFTTGQVTCRELTCYAGGIVGDLYTNDATTPAIVTDSWSSAKVSGGNVSGGVIGSTGTASVTRTYATGAVSCARPSGCYAGGLIGWARASAIKRSFASGAVTGALSSVGGLIGFLDSGTLTQSFATGAVTGEHLSRIGGLIGWQSNATTSEVYAAGRVSKVSGIAHLGGLMGLVDGMSTVTSAYWDKQTTEQTTSAGGYGTALKTAQLRAALPAGFGSAWDITKRLSYPFLTDPHIGFNAPLATLVRNSLVYTYLPIGQLVPSEYRGKPAHADEASRAAVYTMIARAIGAAEGVPQLKDVKIDRYFWKDRTRTAAWDGPVTDRASLGQLIGLGPNAPLANRNVLAEINQQRPVILRGTYRKSGGGTETHWMLATLYTRDPDNTPAAVVAHDPWTGQQVAIDPKTRTVIAPAHFPLSNFKVDAYQAVVIGTAE